MGNLLELDGRVPVRWWIKADNFGDLLSPWLIAKMTGREVVFADPKKPHYLAIGSVLNRTNWQSHVWGAGAFGIEDDARLRAQGDLLRRPRPALSSASRDAGYPLPGGLR